MTQHGMDVVLIRDIRPERLLVAIGFGGGVHRHDWPVIEAIRKLPDLRRHFDEHATVRFENDPVRDLPAPPLAMEGTHAHP